MTSEMAEVVDHPRPSGPRPDRGLIIAGGAVAAAYLVLIVAAYAVSRESGVVMFLLCCIALNAALLSRWRSAAGRTASLVFAVALLVRSFAALAFHRLGGAADPFRGSPDAWSYHVWGLRVADALRDGDLPAIAAHYQTGRWDVGYHYVLGSFYFVFGDSILLGRLVGTLFGALAVLMLLLIARRIAPEPAALTAALIYALWPMSIGWSSETILRDAFVWFLLLAAIWLAARFMSGKGFSEWWALLGVIALLRYTRPYTAFFVAAGLGVVLLLTLIDQKLRPRIAGRAIPLVVLFVSVEALFAAISFPNAVGMVHAYNLPHWIARSLPTQSVQMPSESEAAAGAVSALGRLHPPPGMTALPPPPDAAALDAATDAQPASLAGNAVRLLLGPFGWTFYLPGHSTWAVYSVWFWYLILPAAGIGGISLLRRGSTMPRVLVIMAALYIGLLVLVGRGDAFRQRETVVPFIILFAVAGIVATRNRIKILVPLYVLWFVVLGAAIFVHHRGLADRPVSSHGVIRPPIHSAVGALAPARLHG